MFEGANYFTVYSFLLVLVAVQFLSASGSKAGGQRGTNSGKQLIEHALSQCQKLPEPVYDRLTTSSSGYCCRVQQLATEACCQPPVCCGPTCHRMLFLLQHAGFCRNTFSVCGLLTKGTRNRMETNLCSWERC